MDNMTNVVKEAENIVNCEANPDWKTDLKSRIEKALSETEGTAVESEYIGIIQSAFDSLVDSDEICKTTAEAITDIFESALYRAGNKDDAKKTAQLIMARINTTPDITMAHINWLLTIIGLSFKKGNQIILAIRKYNSRINNICNEQLANLASLAPYRLNTRDRKFDTEAVKSVIDSQLSAL